MVVMFTNNLVAAINAGVPAVAVTTHEWERVIHDVEHVVYGIGLNFHTWDHVNGLISNGEKISEINPNTPFNNPTQLFEQLRQFKNSVVVFLNYNTEFKLPPYNTRNIQNMLYAIQLNKQRGNTFIFISVSGEIPSELEKEIVLLDYDFPTQNELFELIKGISPEFKEFTDENLLLLAEASMGLTQSEAENMIALAVSKSGLEVTPETISEIKRQKAQALKKSGVLELYEPENLPKVGGLDILKLWLWEREKAFLPEARDFGLPFPKGILVFGIPGTGKSLIAKTIARQWDMPLLVMGNVLDKYVGESEKKMKEALRQAEAMSPCILMIDEIEKFFAGVGGGSDSGVSTRVFGQFLSWMQEATAPIFVVATANNIGILPPELLRKGRFDETFFVDLPSLAEREEIFKIHISRKERNVEEFDVNKVAKATPGYTGSEIEQIVISALYRAFSRNKDITTEVLLEIAEETPPLSITMEETITAMRKWGKERAKPASSLSEEPEKLISSFSGKKIIRGVN